MHAKILLQVGAGGEGNILYFILLYLPFIFFMFYGQRFQMQMALLEIGGMLKQLEKMKDFAKREALNTLKREGCEEKTAETSLEVLLNSFTILPTSMDPAGVVGKVEHILNIRDAKLITEVKKAIPKADEATARNVENVVEATAALDQIYRIVRHFYLLGKKMGNLYAVIQLQMLAPQIIMYAKAFVSAVYAFKNGIPIGDGIGALVAAKMINGATTEVIAKDTVSSKLEYEKRKAFIIKAQGPGGNVGKPGEAIKKIIEDNGEKIKLIVMIDAALKLEGEKIGEVAEGIGAAIGGIGVEKFKIEEEASRHKIPLHAVIIKESIADAISVMKKEIHNSLGEVLERVKKIILENSQEEEGVIIAGIGNTIGIAQ
ncbi:MAG: DUF1512 domain-containing protein [Nitrososphaeria archaeon]|nr:DUF1512 domain-containing protein [Nitrososphaeria archaeon]NIN53020.1 DUF1512 domain-containing protein [Nitrososphaeria archaeon]NIQ33579.1 DUF1512 domain-containing protein [Nitrososphaeria archaeon]